VISFRNHVVSLLAVFLALAVGIVLGGGPMSAVGQDADESSSPTRDTARLERAEAQADFGDRLSGELASRAYDDALADRPVAVLSLPGADPGARADLVTQVEAAGGTVTGQYELLEALVAPGEKALVDSLGSQLATQNRGAVADGSTTYDRIGQLVGRAVAASGDKPQQVTGQARTIADSLAAADLLKVPGDADQRAPYVVLLLGSDQDIETDTAYEGLVTGLSRVSHGVVVAGTSEDGSTGRLSRLRETEAAETVATVDGTETTGGLVTTVLAVGAWPRTQGGAFGASGADGTVPMG